MFLFLFQVWICLVMSLILIGPITATINNFVTITKRDKNTCARITGRNCSLDLKTPPKTAMEDNSANSATLSGTWHHLLSSLPGVYFNMFKSLVYQENNLPKVNISISILLIFWFFFGLIFDSKYKIDIKAYIHL